eukprot:CAMPEP_0181232846 /NCGR_PEP_ID=MMETSP1096-20121128/35983_1 /TAXON_ID=156174 ORGANISM="Chrysochromulina ericina, Strain CCMP281" /NCGR_SAMPLE_ID=MMETSP1096 /ASSEMBLY_ACC=CAM_ASM_000453 /LENGTH=30 /DNA_ID= /DNA_START= /DNA_END= /DNA_ORIENTATION=
MTSAMFNVEAELPSLDIKDAHSRVSVAVII